MFRNLCFSLVVALGSSILSARASTITIGATGQNQSTPFSSYYGPEYQQVYSAGDFAGRVTITAITFVETVPSSFTGNFTVSLYTTSKTVNGLGSSFTGNEGGGGGPVFASGTFSNTGTTLIFTAANPFYYDPSAGNLLLDIVSSNVTGTNLFRAGVAADTSRAYDVGGVAYRDTTGLQTQFTYTPVAVTPEPSTLMLLGTGLAFTAGFARRRMAGPSA